MNIPRVAEKVVITFGEAALAYIAVVPHVTWNKALLSGAVGAGISAVYNLARESNPPSTPVVPSVPVQS